MKLCRMGCWQAQDAAKPKARSVRRSFPLGIEEDMAATTRRLVQLGHDLINRSHHEISQTSAAP